ncbi:MAG: GNAT family N-acetyltransferase [Candidatus Limnocylindrales bacterium]
MSIEIRNATPDEYPALIDVISTAFLDRPDVARVATQVRPLWDPARTWIALDGARVCGSFRSWATELTLPGLGRLPAAAVAAVTVLPTHRRRGILTGLAAAEHAAIRERGEAMALLYASEHGIYGRFGYGSATRHATWTVDLGHTRVLAPVGDTGTVELVTPDVAIRDTIRDTYDAWRRTRPGELRRRDFTWDMRLGLEEEAWGEPWKGFVALHRDAAGHADGYLRYKAKNEWDQLPRNRLEVQDLVGLTDEAEGALWAFLGSVDLVASLRAEGRSPAERLPWRLSNPRAATLTELADGMWVRLFDVPRSLAARRYERAGSLVLDVIDDDAVGGRWRVALEASPDGATCVATDRSPDLTLPVAALGSVYLGAHDLRDVALRTGVDEHRAGALAEASAVFGTLREPWCSTFF